ncbi:hypothetical protein LA345_12835 [Burkholderia vietnamiensis]|nr:hypothetical protein [Burkholderia vietnamiensis]
MMRSIVEALLRGSFIAAFGAFAYALHGGGAPALAAAGQAFAGCIALVKIKHLFWGARRY